MFVIKKVLSNQYIKHIIYYLWFDIPTGKVYQYKYYNSTYYIYRLTTSNINIIIIW